MLIDLSGGLPQLLAFIIFEMASVGKGELYWNPQSKASLYCFPLLKATSDERI